MIEPKQYCANPDVTERKLLYNGFVKNMDYYRFKKCLYGNYVSLNLFIDREDHYLVINVQDSNGCTYAPFYNPHDRHNNKVYNEVVKNYNNIMDDLVKKGILLMDAELAVKPKTAFKIKKLNDNAVLPTKGSEYSAGYDLYATDDVWIDHGKTAMVGTGLAMSIPEGYFGGIFARSGLATKQGLRPANCVGVVDSDYRGEVKVALHNDSNEGRAVHTGDRIAQIVLIPYLNINFEETDTLDETERGEGGFGHTGK